MVNTKILVTGLGLGYDIDLCGVCNYDFSWLARNPSILLWTDKIILAENIYYHIKNNESDQKESKAFNLVLNYLEQNKLIQLIKVSDYINPTLVEMIKKQVEYDLKNLPIEFSHEEGDHTFKIENSDFCLPELYSIYTSIILSRMLNANCFHNNKVNDFLNKKIILKSDHAESKKDNYIFSELFNLYLPQQNLFPEYFHCDPKLCTVCVHEKTCEQSLLPDIENNIEKIMEFRTYDEIYQFRDFLNSKIAVLSGMGKVEYDIKSIKGEVDQEINGIRNDINRIIPDLNRKINLISLISIPISLTGMVFSNPLLTAAPIVTTGLIQGARHILENYQSKYNWINYISKIK